MSDPFFTSSKGHSTNTRQMSSLAAVKVVVVGDVSVGKTSLIRQFTDAQFTEHYKATVGADFSSKMVQLNGSDVQIHVWDTAGQERYRSLALSYFKGAEAAVVVFDVTSESSFQRVGFWLEEVLRGIAKTTLDGFPVTVVGNKIDDLDKRRVTREQASEWCRARGVAYIESSAKTGENVATVFRSSCGNALAQRDVREMQQGPAQPQGFKPVTPKPKQPQKEGCEC